ncbi:hypothetical protein EBN03_04160 [Nocardia stercoris]|uniref:Uncharacterized protein n=1 Tax=Nocardia stercoris TaxID=2483361 RepID=A0A3M2LD59_9NOCA|nr:hypothetical protein EBN03_04160 [Nocardia stercoris]
MVVVVLAAGIGYVVATWHVRPTEARRLAEATTIAGFTRTAVVDDDHGDSPTDATAYFVGPPPEPDPVKDVDIPTIPLSPAPPPPTAPEWDPTRYAGVDFAAAKGQRVDGCAAAVTFETHPKQYLPEVGGRKTVRMLTDEQLAAVQAGSLIVIELLVANCGPH